MRRVMAPFDRLGKLRSKVAKFGSRATANTKKPNWLTYRLGPNLNFTVCYRAFAQLTKMVSNLLAKEREQIVLITASSRWWPQPVGRRLSTFSIRRIACKQRERDRDERDEFGLFVNRWPVNALDETLWRKFFQGTISSRLCRTNEKCTLKVLLWKFIHWEFILWKYYSRQRTREEL